MTSHTHWFGFRLSETMFRRCRLALPCAAAAFGVMAAISWTTGLDETAAAWAAEMGVLRAKGSGTRDLLRLLTFAGKTDVQIVLALLIGALGAARCCWRILLALLICSAMVLPLKAIVGRERPDSKDSYSFPSGDVASAAAAATIVAFRFPVLAPACAATVAGVAVMRMFEGAHHPADVLAGAAFGLLAAWLALCTPSCILQIPRPFSPHLLAQGMLLLTAICLIPAAIKGGGVFLDFSEVFLPLMLMMLGWKMVSWRHLCDISPDGSDIPDRIPTSTFCAALKIVLVLCATVGAAVWFLPLVKLRLALFGFALVVGVGCAVALWMERREFRQIARMRLSACVLAATFSLLLLVGPAIFRHGKEKAAKLDEAGVY